MADFDYGTSGSYQIHGPSRLWGEDQIKNFNQQWERDRKNFATYIDRDAKGHPVTAGVFGNQHYYHVKLANGQEGFMMAKPGDPFQVQFKPINVPANEQNWTTIPIRPGAEKYADMLSETQNATNPITGQPMTVRPGNLGDVVSGYNQLQFAGKAAGRQNEAAEVEERWRNAQNLDNAYATAEKIIAKLGPDKIKAMQNWASTVGYWAGDKDQDHQDFYKYLHALATISQYSGGTQTGGSGQKTVGGPQAAGTLLGGLSFVHPLQGVEEVANAIKSGDLDSYDLATNIHSARLLNEQNAVKELSNRSVDATLPIRDSILQEGAKKAEQLETDENLKAGDNPLDDKRPTMWDVIKKQPSGKPTSEASQSSTIQSGPATGAEMGKSFVAADLPIVRFLTGKGLGSPESQPQSTPTQQTSSTSQPQPSPSPTVAPIASPTPVEQSVAASKRLSPSLQLNVPAMAQGGIVTRPTLALLGEAGPERVTPMTAPMGQAPEQTQSPAAQLVANIPTLSAQEHVDALSPGSPFKWQDGLTYVKV